MSQKLKAGFMHQEDLETATRSNGTETAGLHCYALFLAIRLLIP
jgi:hypothetical protein